MARSVLMAGAKGAAVVELQEHLNRTGAMLTCDGDFGIATERIVRACQADAGRPETGIADAAFWTWLEAQPEPSVDLATEAVNAIVKFEVGSRFYYTAHAARPTWPKGESGVTIGVGYDLRFQTPNEFMSDWAGLIPPGQINQLAEVVGRQGSQALADTVSDVSIPFQAAWRVFTGISLPKFTALTRGVFSGFDGLSKLCRGVLVSLVYNRGAKLAGDSRREMAAIAKHLRAGRTDLVAAELIAMKRLWPDAKGLRDRRDAEAGLWTKGLG